KARRKAASRVITPEPCANTPKVGVALAEIVVVTLVPTADLHWPVAGTVSHRNRLTGTVARPVSTETVMVLEAPRLTVATENTPVRVAPGILAMPSPLKVAASATMSGTGVADAD